MIGILSDLGHAPSSRWECLRALQAKCGSMNDPHKSVQGAQFWPAESKRHWESIRKQPVECSISEVLDIQVLKVSTVRFMFSYRHRDYQVKLTCQGSYNVNLLFLDYPPFKASQCQWSMWHSAHDITNKRQRENRIESLHYPGLSCIQHKFACSSNKFLWGVANFAFVCEICKNSYGHVRHIFSFQWLFGDNWLILTGTAFLICRYI